MKKLICLFLTLLFTILSITPVYASDAGFGEVVGNAYSTDILATVNGVPTRTCKIGSKTAIAEDLANYSFDFDSIKDRALRLALNKNDIFYFAPVGYSNNLVNNVIYRSYDGGRTGHVIYLSGKDTNYDKLNFHVFIAYFFDAMNGFILGAGDQPIYVYSTKDGGVTWQNELTAEEVMDIVLPTSKFKNDIELHNAIPWGSTFFTVINEDAIRITVPYIYESKKYFSYSLFTTNGFKEDQSEPINSRSELGYIDNEKLEEIMIIYDKFLRGVVDANDPELRIKSNGVVNISDILIDTTMYSLFDMNGDDVPELHLLPTAGGGYEVFTISNENISLWYSDVDYSSPLNTGMIFYERNGISQDDALYQYTSLDIYGNEITVLEFEKTSVSDDISGKAYVSYMYSSVEVSKETWDTLTKQLVPLESDLIEWYRDIGEFPPSSEMRETVYRINHKRLFEQY